MAAKKKKYTPAVRYLRYEVVNSPNEGVETSHYIDLAKDLSAINRRLMRQGRRYHVKRISIVSSNTIAGWGDTPGHYPRPAGRVTFATVPESWMAQKAWERGFKAWQKMQRNALAEAGSDLRGTWNDFKVYMSADHATGTKLVPLDNGGNAVKYGDWSYTDLITPDGTTASDEFYLTMLGDHVGSAGTRTSVGLIKSYTEARATHSQRPTPETGHVDVNDPILNLFDDGTQVDEIIAKMQTDGEDPPYDIDEFPGDNSNMPKPLVVQQTTLGADGRATVGGFSAMCGLIEVETTSPNADDVYSILVELAPGSYRGVAAEVI
jgi:hypothetical protein